MVEVSKKIIGTHNGSYHCDEVLACLMLTKYVDKYKDYCILRTGEENQLNQCEILVDVGLSYNPERGKFDHHQSGFASYYNARFQQFDIKMSSSGLIWKHFGKYIVKNLIKEVINQESNIKEIPEYLESLELLEFCEEKMYEQFLSDIDAHDNGNFERKSYLSI